MAENSSISWTDDTFNPWEGCQKVGPGCDNCYAEARNARYGGGVAPNWGPGAPRRRTSKANWRKPLRWNREAKASGQPRFVFCASLADVFDNAVPVGWRRDLFDLISATPHLTWLLLTKRPANIVKMAKEMAEADLGPYADERGVRSWWPRNAAIMCTIVNQDEADRDVLKLLEAKRVLRPAFAGLSMEPLLGRVDLTSIRRFPEMPKEYVDALGGTCWTDQTGLPNADPSWAKPGRPFSDDTTGIDWVITGGESGANARPSHPDWFRALRDQCAAAGVAYHHKQNGEWAPGECAERPAPRTEDVAWWFDGCFDIGRLTPRERAEVHVDDEPTVYRLGKVRSGRTLDGVLHDARPEVAHG